MIRFRKATTKDARELASVSRKAFDYDVHYGAPGPGGPPGYDRSGWQSRMMHIGSYYTILEDLRIIGGLIVFDEGGGKFELGRVFLHPDYQNKGIGTQAMAFIEETFPTAKTWHLGTPIWAKRNQHFYEKCGYTRVGLDNNGDGVLYVKHK
jgi:GNAT superfamily N-acetyltransferase